MTKQISINDKESKYSLNLFIKLNKLLSSKNLVFVSEHTSSILLAAFSALSNAALNYVLYFSNIEKVPSEEELIVPLSIWLQ